MAIDLNEYKKNFYSQGGEDGVIQKILDEANISDGFFVEFGAWDGVHLSNTCHLARRGWGGVFIEADKHRFRQLQRNYSSPKIDLVNAMVGTSGPQSLSNILNTRSQYGGLHPAVLSIDIDSDDLAIWQSLHHLRPLIVIIEYNPTMPADVSFQNPPGQQIGNSALAIFEHATSIDYRLVAQTGTNMLFVDGARLPRAIAPLDFFKEQRHHGTRFFFGYEGTLLRASISASGEMTVRADELFVVPWGHAVFPQPVPRFARKNLRRAKTVAPLTNLLSAGIALLSRPVGTARFVLGNSAKAAVYARAALRMRKKRARTEAS